MSVDELKTGPELDALIAEKVMGWIVHPRNTIHWMLRNDDEMDYLVKGKVGIWRPSVNIADAWEVVEKVKDIWPSGFYLTYHQNIGWVCAWKQDHMGPDEAVWEQESAPLAICRAALKAVQEEPKT